MVQGRIEESWHRLRILLRPHLKRDDRICIHCGKCLWLTILVSDCLWFDIFRSNFASDNGQLVYKLGMNRLAVQNMRLRIKNISKRSRTSKPVVLHVQLFFISCNSDYSIVHGMFELISMSCCVHFRCRRNAGQTSLPKAKARFKRADFEAFVAEQQRLRDSSVSDIGDDEDGDGDSGDKGEDDELAKGGA
jgi:hypothetical protein